MKTQSFIIIAAALCGLASFSRAQDIDSFAPVVVKTVPEAGSKDVPPGEYIVKVTFSKEMMDQSWSWSSAWKDSAPEFIGKPKYSADHRVCAVTVKLEPGKTYGWWLNSQDFHNFKDAQGQAAVPYLLTFQCAVTSRLASPENMTDPVTGQPVSSNGTPNLDAKAAVQTWLALMDTGAYPQSWETAADSFHKAMAKDAWVKLSEKVRQPLGQLISRKEVSTQQSPVVPGMPAGSYFTAQFETSFAALPGAVETVEFMQEKDGQWRAIYYLIRPRTAEQTAAVTAAQPWLAGIDAGHYAESWTDAAEFFQGAITQDKWVSALDSVRAPLGKMEIRTVYSAVTETEMPGAPDGKYVVMQFKTSFADKKSATETVTFVLEKGGQWKADGYYIK